MKKWNICLFVVVLLYACSNSEQKTENPIPLSGNVDPISEVQVFLIPSNLDTQIIAKHGTKISITKECFGLIESKEIMIEIKECYSASDVILNKLSTTSNGKLIESDGMVFIKATSGGKEVAIADGETIDVELPCKKRENMQLFYGEKSDNGKVNWNLAESKSEAQAFAADTVPANFNKEIYAKFPIQKLGWINCDRFLDYEDKTDLVVDISKTNEGAYYCLVFENYTSYMIEYPKSNASSITFIDLPANEKVTVIAIGMAEDKKYYYNIVGLNTSDKNTVFPLLEATTPEKMKEEFDKKFGEKFWL